MMAEGGMSARPPRLNPGELRLDKPVLRRPPQGEPAVTRLDEPEVSVRLKKINKCFNFLKNR